MSVFVSSASTAVAQAIKSAGVWVAWGNGATSWDTTPVSPPVSATGLVAEIGRRRASLIDFVTPNASGSIVVPQGTFAVSPTPTSSLYIRANFTNTDAVGQAIRESGVFIGTTTVAGLPVGKDYFAPADLASPGTLMLLERFAKITRTADFSVSLEFVLTL